MTRIMIIRHAEKPGDADPDHGVTENGVHDPHELTVRGWQRAGALVRFFAPHEGAHPALSTPATVLASAATQHSPSRRAMHTVKPLAHALGLPVRHDHPAGEEEAVAAVALATPGPVLIAWHHHRIVALVHAITGAGCACPADWPDERFDLVWVLDRDAGGAWALTQVAQQLLPHDRADVLPL